MGVCTSVVCQFSIVSNLCSLMGVCTCVVHRWEYCVLVLCSQFTFVSRLCSSMGVCTCVVSQFALVSNLHLSMGVVSTCVVSQFTFVSRLCTHQWECVLLL